ncbi:tRNA uracil 4-sulfurtransferase ThiI [Treponema phagedenis]|uniref:tRNA uracil 4-sulfurtransferase ThiI n=1 Tax=Treponema phagedenis TaxID=162 RepID=UPI001649CE41|nr:tRNA uracil 4-sulfurtransferase ThiI [Treponema phagedenis]
MMNENLLYLAKIGEINLKKGNLKNFERRLAQNLSLYLENTGASVRVRAGRLFLEIPSEFRTLAEKSLDMLIGITGWAEAKVAEKNIDSIAAVLIKEAKEAVRLGCKTFKIEARRSDKSFPFTSYEIGRETGAQIHMAGILTVDVHNPDIVLSVEVREKSAFVYGVEHTGRRGLPCGVSGRGLLLLSGGIDSPVAGYRMLFRGMKLDFLYFHSHPYTSPEAQQKVETLAEKLAEYGLGAYLNIVSFTKVQQQIKKTAPEAYLTLMMRMCMMKTAERIAKKVNAQCLITGESLAQVASQTVENLSVTNSCIDFPVFRPLIGMDKEEITALAIKIGTYETSILPYEDCCVLFSPKHPVLHTRLEDAFEIYNRMGIEPFLDEAFESCETKKIIGYGKKK